MVIKPGRRIVDLGKSKIDAQHSDPEHGRYVFLEKVYIAGKNHSEDKFFSWCRNKETDISEWRYSYGFEPVKAGVDPYWPDGLAPSANGLYVRGDLVLVMCPLVMEIERRNEEAKMSKWSIKAKADMIKGQAEKDGLDADGFVDETLNL